jgi:hypothetical protein
MYNDHRRQILPQGDAGKMQVRADWKVRAVVCCPIPSRMARAILVIASSCQFLFPCPSIMWRITPCPKPGSSMNRRPAPSRPALGGCFRLASVSSSDVAFHHKPPTLCTRYWPRSMRPAWASELPVC